MILADKIIENRKKNGWSQEELADRLGVSRQSVSKWESAQAVPDMKRVLQLSEVFGVTTDYLLKDEIEAEDPAEVLPTDQDLYGEEVRQVTMEEASAFLSHNERSAYLVSTGVMLCILSPVLMLMLGTAAEEGRISLSETTAGAMGLVVLLLLVACAVVLFLIIGFAGSKFEYLENSNIETAYGVSGMVKERRENDQAGYSRRMIIGVMMCVIAAIPLFVFGMIRPDDDVTSALGLGITLCIISVGVKLIVFSSVRKGGFDKLLEEGDYTRLNKKVGKYDGIYWAIVTAIYLGWSFVTLRWEFTWIVWPVAGVLFAAYREVMKAIVRSK